MRHLWFLALMALTPAVWGADWKPLPSTAAYQSQVDLDSVGLYGVFLLNRAYVSPQTLASGKTYSTMRAQYFVLCNEGKVSLEMVYFGEGGKLTHIDFQRDWKSKFSAPERDSDVAAAMTQACDRLAGQTDSGGAAVLKKAAPAKPAVRSVSTASGIVITPNGLILTNEHVVRQCDSLQIVLDSTRTVKVTLRAADAARDLALLAVEESFPLAAPVRQDAAPRLGEQVAVIGYPLVNVLSAQPNVSFGHVNSTVGVKGNPAQMQIDVPIQRGNSGGPVLDAAGNLIGIVVSKLDALKLAKSTGDLPQNINFAIRGDVVRSFLEAQHVDFTASSASSKLENTEIATRGTAVTVLVRCIREPAQPARAPATPASP
ncbi:MAG: serine protease [Deltaproteobacteria bacterium]|nr:serine protease [Deltaproteobacteria bacterium]